MEESREEDVYRSSFPPGSHLDYHRPDSSSPSLSVFQLTESINLEPIARS